MQMFSYRSRVRAKYALWLLLIAPLAPLAPAAAQDQPARPDSQFFASLSHTREAQTDKSNGHPNSAGKRRHEAAPGSRVRLISSDGRVLVSRDGPSQGFVWIAPDSVAERDSSWFEISRPAATQERLIIRDWKGRCLGHTDLDGTQPLDFGDCDRHPIFAYPGLSERGFWLVSTMGYVGATRVSPMLVPRSAGDVWFSIQRDTGDVR